MKAFLLVTLLVVALSKNIFLNQAEIVSEVSKLTKSWVAGHNSYFDGKTVEEIKGLMGTILETPEELKLPLKDIEPLKDIPTEFFSATAWPKCASIKEVRDQSTCGSCWAFGAVEAMSDRICIASNQTLQTRISSEDLLTCCGAGCGNGCNGGYPSGAWNYFKRSGIVTGWLYNDKSWCRSYFFAPCDHHVSGKYGPCGASQPTPKCQASCVDGYSGSYSTDKWFADSVYAVSSNVEKIQTEIMTHGPVEAAFTVYNDFLTYKSGVYHHTTGSALGGHAIKVVGWGVESGTPYWLVANSWNEGWGDNGFFKIRRGNNECGIEGQIVAGIPKLKSNVVSAEQ
jgi:cathepsin B